MGNANLIAAVGGFYYILSPLVIFGILLLEMSREKELNLRKGLHVVGLGSGAYWCHWGVTAAVFCMVSTLLLQLSSMVAGFEFFFKAPFLLLFIFFLEFSFAIISLAFLVTTCVSSSRMAYAFSFAIILLAIVVEMSFCNVMMYYYIFMLDASSTWIVVARRLTGFFPPFIFAKIYGHMTRISSTHFDDLKLTWVRGVPFEWDYLFQPIHSKFITGDAYSLEPPIYDHLQLLLDGLIFLLLAAYFDHVLSSNRGSSDSVCYFLSRRYWETFCCCWSKKSTQHASS